MSQCRKIPQGLTPVIMAIAASVVMANKPDPVTMAKTKEDLGEGLQTAKATSECRKDNWEDTFLKIFLLIKESCSFINKLLNKNACKMGQEESPQILFLCSIVVLAFWGLFLCSLPTPISRTCKHSRYLN